MRMSDIVAEYIINMLNVYDGQVDIQRNELAGTLGCVPSQINYVISSRFTPEQGYVVESRRGGGGYIRISRVHLEVDNSVMHIVNSIGDDLDTKTAEVILDNLQSYGVISEKERKVIASAISERVYMTVPKEYRKPLRASVLKNMLLASM